MVNGLSGVESSRNLESFVNRAKMAAAIARRRVGTSDNVFVVLIVFLIQGPHATLPLTTGIALIGVPTNQGLIRLGFYKTKVL
jgi:hypothetical protein